MATVLAAVIASIASTAAGWPSPLESAGELLIEWTPVGLAGFLLLHLNTFARPAALLGALAISMLVGGVAGALHGIWGGGFRQQVLGMVSAGTVMVLAFFWFLQPTEWQPEMLFVGTFLLALGYLNRPNGQPEIRGRAEFLMRSSIILGGAAVLLTLFSVRPLLRALAIADFFPYRPPRGLKIEGITAPVTTNSDFYVIDKVLQYPEIDISAWRLVVKGLVGRELSLDYASFLARPRYDRYVTLECIDNPVGGPLISNALWSGIQVKDLLRQAEAKGDTVVLYGQDGYRDSTSREDLERAGAFIAYAMNGKTLPKSHGYPARLVLPGIYGFKSVKWLDSMEITGQSTKNEWQGRGWTATAEIHTTTRIDVARRQGNQILLAGITFAGARGVRAVEVRANGGTWHRATLGRALSSQSWVQWAIRLVGYQQATVEVRAIDGEGQIQAGYDHGAYPNGATGWPSVSV